jgi:site-specific recombinase XerD
MYTAFKQYLSTLKLSPVSRKLYLSDIKRFLSWVGLEPTLDQVSSSKSYADYLSYLQSQAIAPSMLKRTTASLKQFGTFISLTYSLPNPFNMIQTTPATASDDYIKHFTNYLTSVHLSPLTIKSYKSDVSRYLTWASEWVASNNMDELLSEKNIGKYLNYLSQFDNAIASTIERKSKSLGRIKSWYQDVYAKNYITDNTKVHNIDTRSIKETLNSIVHPTSLESTPEEAVEIVKNKNSRKGLFSFVPNFITLLVLLVFTAALAIFGYQQFARDVRLTAAFPNTPVTPNRQLSFQGRLEDAAGTPITTATDVTFKLWDDATVGSQLYSTGVCSLTPDTDGVFSTQIGSDCGAAIASSVFTENASVWLEVTVEAETLTPRQPIASVAYALNSETIQGFPISATVSAIRNTVVPMNQWGEIIVGEQSPRLTGVSGTFQISAPALSFVTTAGSNGNITLAPDGTGQVNVNGNTTTTNFFNVNNAQLTTGSLITGTVANNNVGYYLLNLLSGSTPTSKFSVDDAGNTVIGGTLTLPNSNILTGVTNYTQFSQGISVGGATTYYFDGSGNINANTSTFAGTLQANGTFDANGQVDLGDGGDAVTINGSSVTLTGFNCTTYTNGGTLTTNASGVVQCDNDDGGGGSGSSNWQSSLGALSPINSTWDVLVGGTATASAKAGFININSGTPTATVSAGVAGGAYLTAAGNLATTANQTLTLGGSETGNIVIAPGGVTALTAIGANLTAAGDLNLPASTNLIFGGTTSLGEFTGNTDSGAYNVGVFDEFTYSTNTNVQAVLKDLDTNLGTAITSATIWTDAGTYIYPTNGEVLGNSVSGGANKVAGLYLADSAPLTFGTDNDVPFSFSGSTLSTALGVNSWNIASNLLFLNGATNQIGIGTNSPLATLDIRGLSGTTPVASISGNTAMAALVVDQSGIGDLFTASKSGDPKFVITGAGNVGIGVTAPTNKLEIGGATSTISNTSGDITIDSASNFTSFAGDSIGNILDVQLPNSNTISGVAGYTQLSAGLAVGGNTTYYIDSSGNAKFLDLQVADTGNAGLTVGNGSTGFAKIGSFTIGDNNASVVTFDTNSDATPEFQLYNTGSATASGDITMGGQLQVGRFAATPTAVGEGAMIFNTTTNTHQCYNGTTWYNCGGTLYSNTNAAVADGSYITVTHNLGTNDLLSSAWINAQGVWKSLESSYQPAIAWEGKDTQRGLYHNEVNLYKPSTETNIYSDNTLQNGLLFDTFEDETKTDSANTTASVANQVGDNGSSNYMTLNQRVQDGRTGLMGGQTYSTSTTDNDGQTYLGSNTVNDIYYYDRSKDSSPDVQVELGIDPNWYNGVTLSVATSSANYSQNGTIADKNPNLTTTYNGSLIKVTGTDTTPRTIYITIKSPTSFDWTNYQGDAATGVTITPGTTQTLGDTGVSVTFSAATYNVGDVFKIASWYIEGESATRGAKQQFPERSNIIAEGNGTSAANYVDIIDADTQKLWMRFDTSNLSNYLGSTTQTRYPTSVHMLNGKLAIGETSTTSGILIKPDFTTDTGKATTTTGEYVHTHSISNRNTGVVGFFLINNSVTLPTTLVNDVTSAVIPNAPTQEVTVSGWGYIIGAAAATTAETVKLPYKFNKVPNVTMNATNAITTTAPTSLADCTGTLQRVTGFAQDITQNTFEARISISDAADTTLSTTTYYCYTWVASGSVSPKQFVVAATGNSTSGGTSIINETDGTVAHVLTTGGTALSQVWQTKAAIADNQLYLVNNTAASNVSNVQAYYGLHGLSTEATATVYRRRYYELGAVTTSSPSILGTATGTGLITSLAVTPGTSTIDGTSNTIYVGTTTGTTVIQEKQGSGNIADGSSGDEAGGSAKYYTGYNISEEMIGDIRGMWSLNNANTSSDFEDNSIKGETLTGTNIASGADSVSGVRNTATDFDGSTEYMTCTDANCGGTTELDSGGAAWSVGGWVKTSSASTMSVISKATTAQLAYQLAIVAGVPQINVTATAGSWDAIRVATRTINDGNWHHVVASFRGSNSLDIFIDGVLSNGTLTGTVPATIRDTTQGFYLSTFDGTSQFFNGSMDEVFVTATYLTANQVKHMYHVGARALQSHSTGLGGDTADVNQQLGFHSSGSNTSSIGSVVPDWNNQYMYVGTNSTTLGSLSKIQLNSDTNIKTYSTADNDPDGGPAIVEEDITALGVGYTLEAVGSATAGVKSMGFDNNSTATSGNYVSRTMTLPKNIGSAVLWVSPVLDASDGSNTLTVQASNDGGSNYATCTLVNTNSNPAVPEREYACTFSTADNELKVRFQFARSSTATNTYITQYGISWLGETGFRVEQVDANNTRLYNFSGEAQNLKLNVTGASTSVIASPWTDAGSYIYATGYETLRMYDSGGTNYLGLSHNGTVAQLSNNATVGLNIDSSGNIGIGTTSPASLLHLSTATDTEFRLTSTGGSGRSYSLQTGTDGVLQFIDRTAVAARMVIDSSGNIGIGDYSPDAQLDIDSTATTTNVFGITASSLTTGSMMVLTGPTSGTVDDHGVKLSSDISGNGVALLRLDSDLTGAGSNSQAYGIQNLATDATSNNNSPFASFNLLTLTGNATKTGRSVYGRITSSSTTADVLYAGDFVSSTTGAISTGTRNSFGVVGSAASTAANTGGSDLLFGLYGNPSSANSTTGSTVYLYGAYLTSSGVLTTGGTMSQFGAYIANGTSSTVGTTNKYGLYVESQTGADTNYGAYIGSAVGIGTTTPQAFLEVNGSISYTTPGTHAGSSGAGWTTGIASTARNASILASNSILANGIFATSDERLKKDVETLDSDMVDAFFNTITPVSFKWKADNLQDSGFIAQDLAKKGFGYLINEVPDDSMAGFTNSDGFTSPSGYHYTVNYNGIIPILAAGIQKNNLKIAALQNLSESGDVILSGNAPTNYTVSNDDGVVSRIGAFAKATIAQITAGLTRTNELEVGTISPLAEGQNIEINAPVVISANNGSTNADLTVEGEIDANQISARTAYLTNIEAETITARNIIADTISANHIEGLDAKIASLSAGLSDSDVETITDRIKSRLATLTGNAPNAEDIPEPSEATNSAYLSELTGDAQIQIASDSAYLASADIDFVTINDYLAVIGQAVITDLDVTGHLYASSLNSKTGTLALADNTLIITAGGQVAINGDLTVSGKILADSAELNSLSLGNPSSATSSALGQLLAIYDEQGMPVATIDASGSANLASLTTNMITIASPATASQSGLASLLGTAQSNATAGESILVSPNTELTIESPYVTANSLVYLTPTGNTENKVLFVKSKTSCTPNQVDCIPSFTVGIDAPASSDITFNWWIIQLAPPQPETAQ